MYLLINNTSDNVSPHTKEVGYPISRCEYIVAEKDDDIHKTLCSYIYAKDYYVETPKVSMEEIFNDARTFIENSGNKFDGIIYVDRKPISDAQTKLKEIFDYFNDKGCLVVLISTNQNKATYSRVPLLIATTSSDKAMQIIFAIENMYPNKYTYYKLNDLDITYEVEEPFDSYQQNAMKKSSEYSLLTGMITISDDTGVEIQALNGEPGVKSARWGDTSKQPAFLNVADYMKENELSSVCKMITCISISIPNDDEILTKSFTTSVDGFWCWNPQGEFGFAYDPYFLLPTGKTIAQYNINEQFTNGVTPRMKSTVQAIKYLNVF